MQPIWAYYRWPVPSTNEMNINKKCKSIHRVHIIEDYVLMLITSTVVERINNIKPKHNLILIKYSKSKQSIVAMGKWLRSSIDRSFSSIIFFSVECNFDSIKRR